MYIYQMQTHINIGHDVTIIYESQHTISATTAMET